MRVFVIIPIHDHIDETLRCLDCLALQTLNARTIVVVDGGSTDGTPERIAERHPYVTVLPGDRSMWWTAATALGVEHVRPLAQPGDFVLTLNNDTRVGPDYLEQIVAASNSHGRALVGSLNVDIEDSSRIVDSGVWWNWRTASSRQVDIEPGTDSTTAVNTLSGRGMLVPIEVFEAIGNFDAGRLPHYAADYEFAMRAARAGFGLALSYLAVVRVNTETTGREGDLATPVGFGAALSLLLSRRSIRNVFHRLRFVSMACPEEYKWRNYLAVLAASAWLLTNVPGLFQAKNFLLRLILPAGLKSWMRARKLIPLEKVKGGPKDQGT